MNPSVLIVDDDPVVRDLLSRFLRSHNFDTAVLHDGVHLQRRLERERPSIVVLDIMMPETDGLEAIAALRAAGDNIPVIFVTARGAVSDCIRGLSLGADDYLPKPFRLRRVIEADPSNPRHIQTVRGKGYVFVPDPANYSEAHGAAMQLGWFMLLARQPPTTRASMGRRRSKSRPRSKTVRTSFTCAITGPASSQTELAIVARLARDNGGACHVENHHEGGLLVRLTFPARRS